MTEDDRSTTLLRTPRWPGVRKASRRWMMCGCCAHSRWFSSSLQTAQQGFGHVRGRQPRGGGGGGGGRDCKSPQPLGAATAVSPRYHPQRDLCPGPIYETPGTGVLPCSLAFPCSLEETRAVAEAGSECKREGSPIISVSSIENLVNQLAAAAHRRMCFVFIFFPERSRNLMATCSPVSMSRASCTKPCAPLQQDEGLTKR